MVINTCKNKGMKYKYMISDIVAAPPFAVDI